MELWTAKTSIIDALEYLYAATEALIKERSRQFGSIVDESASDSNPAMRLRQNEQVGLKNYLAGLAAAFCTNMEDKLRAASV